MHVAPFRLHMHKTSTMTLTLSMCFHQEVNIYPTNAQPLVYGQWLHAKGAPTVLIYGHYDVQPVDPLELWKTSPFDAQLLNGEFLGRGVADDKGGLLQPIQAVEALLATSGGKLPVNVKVCKQAAGSVYTDQKSYLHEELGCWQLLQQHQQH